MLTIQNLNFRIQDKALFQDASLTVPNGYRVGLVGPNGTGKSTLFKLITGELELDSGDIVIQSGAKVSYVRQDLPDDDTPIIDVVLASDTERANLLNELETTADAIRLGEIYMRLEDIHAYEAPARAATILAGLGFDNDAQQAPIKAFSGGWKMRVALAAALFLEPDLLLLDEPTNHLDFEAIIWLENFLASYPHTLILISHDRDILNKACNHIVNLENQILVHYKGNYDQFEQTRALKLSSQQALYEKQQAQKSHMMDFVRRLGAKASKAKQAQSRLKSIEKMDLVDAVIAERATNFTFPEPDNLSSDLISLQDVSVGYEPGHPILSKLSLSISMDDRIALLGANGNGKSTFIKLLANQLQAECGDVYRTSKLRVGYFAQHQTDELDVNSTAFEVLQEKMPHDIEPKVRAVLGHFGFDKTKADTQIAQLSGGEKARLLFCLMSFNAPHIMLLDEPTNHLDMDAREALMQALNNYPGCVIIVSHDPIVVERVADELWLIDNGQCQNFPDDLQAYKKLVLSQRQKNKRDKVKKKNAKNAKQLEKEIETLSKEIAKLEDKLAKPDIYNNQQKANLIQTEISDKQSQLAILEEEWIKLSE